MSYNPGYPISKPVRILVHVLCMPFPTSPLILQNVGLANGVNVNHEMIQAGCQCSTFNNELHNCVPTDQLIPFALVLHSLPVS